MQFFNKIILAVAVPFKLTICFWLITLRRQKLWICVFVKWQRHMYLCWDFLSTNAQLRHSLFSFFPFVCDGCEEKSFFISYLNRNNTKNSNKTLAADDKAKTLYQYAVAAESNLSSKPFTIANKKVITYRKFDARTFFEYAICFD